MTDFLPRTEPVVSVTSAAERGFSGVRGSAVPASVVRDADTDAQRDTQLTERSAAVASYAKLQANIADVVARLEPPHSTVVDAGDAGQQLLALMPQPVVVLPLPPTDQKMIEFVAQVAQSLASQAALARAAQASVSPATVEAVAA
ncbi:MAG: hypothetical protein J7494_13745 [Sphingobium sp.]|nr:hypothetical protein [Sphingobium sp.]